MSWKSITSQETLEEAIESSFQNKIILFKHSRTCSISTIAKTRLEQDWKTDLVQIYYLDLLAYRDISNTIAERFDVRHESPQVLIIDQGQCIFDTSHLDISASELESGLNEVNF